MYLDNQQPRILPRDENGFVADIHDPTSNCFNEAGGGGVSACVTTIVLRSKMPRLAVALYKF